MLGGQVTRSNSDVAKLRAQVQQHEHTMSGFERQLKDIAAGRYCGSGDASRTAPSELNPVHEREKGSVHPPKNQRTVLVVGGFPCDTERDVICEKLREMFGHEKGVTDWWTDSRKS